MRAKNRLEGYMRKTIQIDEAEYKRAMKYGADALINKNIAHDKAEVNEIDGKYWLSFEDYPMGQNDWQE
jgi:hypothetical protein